MYAMTALATAFGLAMTALATAYGLAMTGSRWRSEDIVLSPIGRNSACACADNRPQHHRPPL